MIMSFARAILFFYVCVRAAKKLHNKMFTAVLRVPMRFFDVNPIGTQVYMVTWCAYT